MLMEKETTGIYISGHPMDDYRKYLKKSRAVPIASLTEENANVQDDQIVSVAGIVQSIKMKATRNGSSMAYVVLEDDTGSIETIVFSKVIEEHGGYLRENNAVVVTGRLSLRDDKEPQIVINRARPITDYSESPPVEAEGYFNEGPIRGTLYLRLPGEEGKLYPKVRAVLNMFPGEEQVVLYFSDTKVRRGTRCVLRHSMLQELKNILGEGNVVLK